MYTNFLHKTFECARCGDSHSIHTSFVQWNNTLVETIASLLAVVDGKSLFFIMDEVIFSAFGKDFVERVKQASPSDVGFCVLKPLEGFSLVHCDKEFTPQIEKESAPYDVIVSLGTGSITDLAKYVGYKSEKKYYCIATAASMNAYTSHVVAMLDGNLKVTIPYREADGVFIPRDIIMAAPPKLAQSGFADSLAKGFANADWKMSCVVDPSLKFCSLGMEMVAELEKTYVDRGDSLDDPKVMEALMDALIGGGFSMVVAGTSSPASGGEHLISHFLDVQSSLHRKEPPSFHGLQVGIGCLFSAWFYDRLKEMDAKEVEKRLRDTSGKTMPSMDLLSEIYGDVLAPRVMEQISAKEKTFTANMDRIVEQWDHVQRDILCIPHSFKDLMTIMQRAKLPVRFSDIGVDRDLGERSVKFSRYFRNRVVILDVAAHLGLMDILPDELF